MRRPRGLDSPAAAGEEEAAPEEQPVSLASARAMLRQARRARRRGQRQRNRRLRRATRRRRLVLACSAFAFLVLAGSAALAVSPLNALHTVTVEGADPATAAQVKHALAGQTGRPLALISKAGVRGELAHIPRIGSYSLVLRPPGTMVVRVVERVPIAAVQRGGGYATVDSAGVTIATSDAAPHYPVVKGGVDGPGFAAAVAVIEALPADVDGRIATVSASTTDNVTFTLRGAHGATVAWGDASQPHLKAEVLAALLKAVPHASHYDVSSPADAVTR